MWASRAVAIGAVLACVVPGAAAAQGGSTVPDRSTYSFTMPAGSRPTLGLTIRGEPAREDSLGALVVAVSPGGPAARAGLRAGDVVTRVNGQPLSAKVALRSPLLTGRESPAMRMIVLTSGLSVTDTVALEYTRGSARRTLRLVPERLPAEVELRQRFEQRWPEARFYEALPSRTSEAVASRALAGELTRMRVVLGSPLGDVQLAPLNDQLGRYFGTDDGVLVLNVPDGTPLPLEGGDVILRVDGRAPDDPMHLLRILRSYGPGEEFRLEIMRERRRRTVTSTVPAAEPTR